MACWVARGNGWANDREEGREDAVSFWKMVRWRVQKGICRKPDLLESIPVNPYRRCLKETIKHDGHDTVVVANLKPRSLRGVESKGMLLFADNVADGKERVEFVSTAAKDGNPVT